ncbi:flagellar export protein FliJ [Clostridium polynesiense]|uniref:flagellar export protein FliJ n=1 Tax=Clostridium polynesiense TaxID=1325933 RepID=UPI00058DCCC8|nr:flagellar export protein FliJ [Clostridium polynesiense]
MESKFNFGLQKLLDIRIEREEESKRYFLNAQCEKNRAEERLTELQSNYDKYNRVDNKETVVIKKIKKNYLNALTMTIDQAEKELEYKEIQLSRCREDLKDRQIDRKTVEVLKDKRYIEFIKQENLREQKMNDEFALYSFIRKSTERR